MLEIGMAFVSDCVTEQDRRFANYGFSIKQMKKGESKTHVVKPY